MNRTFYGCTGCSKIWKSAIWTLKHVSKGCGEAQTFTVRDNKVSVEFGISG